MLSTKMKKDVELPPEVWESIVDSVLATYLDQAWVPIPKTVTLTGADLYLVSQALGHLTFYWTSGSMENRKTPS